MVHKLTALFGMFCMTFAKSLENPTKIFQFSQKCPKANYLEIKGTPKWKDISNSLKFYQVE
jgi:hypothetical protein